MARVSQLWVVVVGVCSVFGVGCSVGSSGDPNGNGEPPVASEDYLAAFHRVFCDTVGPCCTSAGIAFDWETCFQTAQQSGGFLPELENPAFVYDGDAARRCLNSFKARIEACEPYDDTKPDAGCDEVFKGTLTVGQPCQRQEECSSGLCDIKAQKCVAEWPLFPRAGEGQPCDSECDARSEGTYCDTFKLELQAGTAACYEADGLQCDRSGPAELGECRPIAKLGETCYGGRCLEGYCDSTTTCSPLRGPGPCDTGEACGIDRTCFGLGVDTPGECRPPAPDGAPCWRAGDCLNGSCRAGDDTQPLCGKPTLANPTTCAGM